MPSGIGNTYALRNLAADHGSGSPATWYAALMMAAPMDGDQTSAVECSYSGYARIAWTNNTTNFPAPTVVTHIATSVLQAALAFAAVAGLGGGATITVVGVQLFDASTAGNAGRFAVFGTVLLPVSFTLANGASITVAAGNTSFQEQ
jgi:hypothetical protein